MAVASDRRVFLSGLGALGLVGCGSGEASAPTDQTDPSAPAVRPIDLSDLERDHGGRLGLAAMDFNQVSWRGDERFNYCSTFKLFLAAATLERVQRDEEALDRAIPIIAADMIAHAPVTGTAVGQTLTIEALMKATVEVSDNPAANILIREMGGLDALRAWYRSIGDTVTTVDRLEPMLNVRAGDRDTTRPRQTMINLGWMLDTYKPLGFASRYGPLWDWLINSPTGRGRIKAGVPNGWTVAHKTGTGGRGQTNDIGVIHPPVGEPIRIAVYYDAPAELEEAKREAVIAQATQRALKALGHEAAV